MHLCGHPSTTTRARMSIITRLSSSVTWESVKLVSPSGKSPAGPIVFYGKRPFFTTVEILKHIIHSPFFYSHQGGCTFAVTSYVIGVKSRCDSHHQSAPRGCEETSQKRALYEVETISSRCVHRGDFLRAPK